MVDNGDPNPGGGIMKRQNPEHKPTNYIEVGDIDAHIKTLEEF